MHLHYFNSEEMNLPKTTHLKYLLIAIGLVMLMPGVSQCRRRGRFPGAAKKAVAIPVFQLFLCQ
jgi:hypothetical protein